eukprot:TRINITY_DN7407_c0_g1_i3.p1 TRINITY_DN7407_c0_g1~~TRINITY_DN7407_c0_g1_i3.p1  ORF type:complete len:255 (-),score=12.61 TRINITY_DN7407_c0_g1_i3:226-990(-)
MCRRVRPLQTLPQPYFRASHPFNTQCQARSYVLGLTLQWGGTCLSNCNHDGPVLTKVTLHCSGLGKGVYGYADSLIKPASIDHVVDSSTTGSCPTGYFVHGIQVVVAGTCNGKCDADGPSLRRFILQCQRLLSHFREDKALRELEVGAVLLLDAVVLPAGTGSVIAAVRSDSGHSSMIAPIVASGTIAVDGVSASTYVSVRGRLPHCSLHAACCFLRLYSTLVSSTMLLESTGTAIGDIAMSSVRILPCMQQCF